MFFPQTAVSNCPMTIPTQYTLATQQSFIPQRQPMAGNLGQYTHVNESMPPLQQPQHPMSYANNSVQVASVSPQPCQPMFENQVRQQPVLHPLQQATLLQQRQMLSEVRPSVEFLNVQNFPYCVATYESITVEEPESNHTLGWSFVTAFLSASKFCVMSGIRVPLLSFLYPWI